VGKTAGGNVGSANGGNVGKAPKGNVDKTPKGNVDKFPRGNVENYPRGNVDVFPFGNVDQFPSGNVDAAPSSNVGTLPMTPKPSDGKSTSKPAASSSKHRHAKENAKTGAEAAEKKDAKPGVTGPIVFGDRAPSHGAIGDLEQVRERLNLVGYDYQGRRAAAVAQVAHAIHMLRFGRSDPNAADSVLAIKSPQGRTLADAEIMAAITELESVAARLRTNAYFNGSAALNAVERALADLRAALKTSG